MSHKNSRRSFLKSTMGTGAIMGSSAVLGIDAIAPACFSQAAHASERATGCENVLVVIQLSGGNDGLNTVVPLEDPAYYAARPKLAIRKQDALRVHDSLALHPSLKTLAGLCEAGQFSIIHGVGYENPNRSHFESMDIWHTCQPKNDRRNVGWIGSFLDGNASQLGGDVPALHLGENKQPLALSAQNVRVPSIASLEEFQLRSLKSERLKQLLTPTESEASKAGNDLLGYVQSNAVSALEASQRVSEVTKTSHSGITYPDTRLSERLSIIARLIDAELATRVYYVELDGFDTHAQQPDAHASLLREWAGALGSFTKDLEARGHLERTCVLTFSEFGRRVAENASDGTDHGAAAPVFLAGGQLATPVHGSQPSLTDLADGDLKFAVDFRSIYATLLQEHLGWKSGDSWFEEVEPLPLFRRT